MTTPGVAEYSSSVPIDLIAPHKSLNALDFRPSAGLVGNLISQGVESVTPAVLAVARGDQRFVLLDGVDLWLACQKAKVHSLPAIVYKDADPAWMKKRALQTQSRKPGNAMDMAEQLATVWGASRRKISKAELGRRFGLERSRVSHYLRLLNLNKEVRDLVRSGKLSMGQARPLVTFPHGVQSKIAAKAVSHGWSTRQIELACKTIKTGEVSPQQKAKTKSADQIRIERIISEQVGVVATLDEGKLTLNYGGSLDVLDGVLERLGVVIS